MSVGPYEQSLRERAIAARRNLVGKVPVSVIQRLALIAATPVKKRGPVPQPIEPAYLPEEAPTPQLGSARIIKEVSRGSSLPASRRCTAFARNAA